MTSDSLREAVSALCHVINTYTRGYWIVDSTSGVNAEKLKNQFNQDVVIKHPHTDVQFVAGDIEPAALNAAIYAVSAFVKGEAL